LSTETELCVDGYLIFAIFLAIMAVVAFFVARNFEAPGPAPVREKFNYAGDYQAARSDWRGVRAAHRYTRWAVFGLAGLTFLFFAFACVTKVGTNQIGIMNSFGRPVDAFPNGMHLKAPWETKVEFDASRQFLRFEGSGNKETEHGKKVFPCFNVRIANNANGCVKGVVTWQMRARTAQEKQQAVELYRQYRTFERLNDNFVAQATQSALNATYADVNPLVPEKNPSFAELSNTAEIRLHGLVGTQVEVLDFQITFIDYDDKTDDAIKRVQAQIANTAEETQRQLTNAAAARAAAALGSTTQGPPPSEAVLINKCLDIAAAQNKEPGYCFMRGGQPLIQAR
jgi:regulator of protease activity HflC (stomatin/prohibitin superfamily)